MGHMPRTPDYIELPTTRDRITRAIDDELRAHLNERIAELTAAGLANEDARAQALREFGDLDAAKRDLRRIDELAAGTTRFLNAADDLATDIWRTVRSLVRRPGFAAVAILTLALGIGANAVMSASWIACCSAHHPISVRLTRSSASDSTRHSATVVASSGSAARSPRFNCSPRTRGSSRTSPRTRTAR